MLSKEISLEDDLRNQDISTAGRSAPKSRPRTPNKTENLEYCLQPSWTVK